MIEFKDIKEEWAHWDAVAQQQKDAFRPEAVMRDFPAPTGYRAQLCVRKNPKKFPGKYQEFIARALVWNENTGVIAFDYGAWVQPHFVEKKLRVVLRELDQVQRTRAKA
jgi:hypothetical protein